MDSLLEAIEHPVPDVGVLAFNDRVKILSMMYCTGKLNGESGEVAELVFKAFRGGETETFAVDLLDELGDVLWYVARLADLAGYSLETVMNHNLMKLQDRKQRGVIHGYGDHR